MLWCDASVNLIYIYIYIYQQIARSRPREQENNHHIDKDDESFYVEYGQLDLFSIAIFIASNRIGGCKNTILHRSLSYGGDVMVIIPVIVLHYKIISRQPRRFVMSLPAQPSYLSEFSYPNQAHSGKMVPAI